MRRYVAVFVLVSLKGVVGFAQLSPSCEPKGILGRRIIKDIYDFQKKAFNSNLEENCKKLLEYDTRKSREEFEKGIVSSDYTSDWELSLIPDRSPRLLVFHNMLVAKNWGLIGKDDVKAFLNGEKQVSANKENDGGGYLVISKLKSQKLQIVNYGLMSNTSKIASNPLVSTAVCAELNVLKSISCGKALSKILSWMKVDWISLPDVFDDVLQNKNYEAGITIAARKLISKAEAKEPGPNHLFQDLYSSFIQSGASEKDAQKMTWDTIGLISTGGANLGDRLSQLRDPAYSDKSMISLLAISDTMPYLDHLNREKNGETYSFPQGMKFKCDNGKPYHFLMTAYFSHRLVVEEGFEQESAAMASFISAKGYQMLADHPTRRSDISSWPVFHEEVNLKRLDLVHDAAGSWYGASGKTEDIDSGMKRMIESANPPLNNEIKPRAKVYADSYTSDKGTTESKGTVATITEAVKQAYYFNQIISPNSIFNFYKSQ